MRFDDFSKYTEILLENAHYRHAEHSFRPLQRLNIGQIVSMLQRRTRTAPTTRFGALLGPLVPIYSRNVAHLGPQERPKI